MAQYCPLFLYSGLRGNPEEGNIANVFSSGWGFVVARKIRVFILQLKCLVSVIISPIYLEKLHTSLQTWAWWQMFVSDSRPHEQFWKRADFPCQKTNFPVLKSRRASKGEGGRLLRLYSWWKLPIMPIVSYNVYGRKCWEKGGGGRIIIGLL